MPDEFSNRRVILTGGATGVGAALLDLLAEQGASDVTVLDVKTPPGPHATFIETDLSDPNDVDAAIAAIEGPVDVLFNNAGVADTLPPPTVFQVNALAPVRLGTALLPQLREGGAIVNTASIAGLRWADNLELIGELLDIDDWEKALAWFDGRELGVDTYSFTKQVVQVWTMRFSQTASARGRAGQQRVSRAHRHTAARRLPGDAERRGHRLEHRGCWWSPGDAARSRSVPGVARRSGFVVRQRCEPERRRRPRGRPHDRAGQVRDGGVSTPRGRRDQIPPAPSASVD